MRKVGYITFKGLVGILSTGLRYLLCNLPTNGYRDLLVIAVSRPGGKAFAKMWKVRDGHAPALKAGPEWSYPCAVEADGKLYVVRVFAAIMGVRHTARVHPVGL